MATMSKRELLLEALFCEPAAVPFGLLKIDQRFRHQPEGVACEKVGRDTWRPVSINMQPQQGYTANMARRVYPIHEIEDIMKDDQRYNGHTNWATWNIKLWVFNEEGVYLQMVANRPYVPKSAEVFVREAFLDGIPGMAGKEAGEMENVDWESVAEAFNEE